MSKIVRMRTTETAAILPFCHSEGVCGEFLTSNVFSTVRCRVCSVIASESEVVKDLDSDC